MSKADVFRTWTLHFGLPSCCRYLPSSLHRLWVSLLPRLGFQVSRRQEPKFTVQPDLMRMAQTQMGHPMMTAVYVPRSADPPPWPNETAPVKSFTKPSAVIPSVMSASSSRDNSDEHDRPRPKSRWHSCIDSRKSRSCRGRRSRASSSLDRDVSDDGSDLMSLSHYSIFHSAMRTSRSAHTLVNTWGDGQAKSSMVPVHL